METNDIRQICSINNELITNVISSASCRKWREAEEVDALSGCIQSRVSPLYHIQNGENAVNVA